MKTLIIILILSTSVLCQNKLKISQETYDGLVARQFKSVVTYDGPRFFILESRRDISTAGWDWPSNSSYNQYSWRVQYGLLYDTAQSYRRVYARAKERQRIQSLESKPLLSRNIK